MAFYLILWVIDSVQAKRGVAKISEETSESHCFVSNFSNNINNYNSLCSNVPQDHEVEP